MQIKWKGLKALSQQTALVFAGKMTGACLGFVMSLIVARWMGPEEFGLFSLFIVILIFGNDVLGDGLNPGVVRFYAMNRRTDPARATASDSARHSDRVVRCGRGSSFRRTCVYQPRVRLARDVGHGRFIRGGIVEFQSFGLAGEGGVRDLRADGGVGQFPTRYRCAYLAVDWVAVLGACYGSPCFFLLCVYRMGSMAAAPPPIKFQA